MAATSSAIVRPAGCEDPARWLGGLVAVDTVTDDQVSRAAGGEPSQHHGLAVSRPRFPGRVACLQHGYGGRARLIGSGALPASSVIGPLEGW
jgi:hypothetical protein